MESIGDYVALLSAGQLVLWTLALTTAIEAITILLRFGFNLQAARTTSFVGRFTFGIRIHHGYVGIIMLVVAWLRPEPVNIHHLLLIVGGALLLSDIIHHLLVLWPITGSPQFHLTYPPRRRNRSK